MIYSMRGKANDRSEKKKHCQWYDTYMCGACKWQKFRLIRQFSANSYVAVLLTSSSNTKILEKLPALYSGAVTIGKAISRLIGRIHLSI